ncbi:restriction endonuclease subunit S [Virgibacillus sp. JSM 102003]|uniref:restriction endonuclease subunit S n=1 Tax=Virgibacillus sp. JSM 102003 TaxID=1562108 RepID=UPI0035C1C129
MSEWEKVKLEDVAEIVGGGTPSRQETGYWNGNIKWVTPTDITKNNNKYLDKTLNTITEIGLQKSAAKLIDVNNVLMTTRATIGKCVINRIPVTTNQGFTNFISKNELIDPEFLYYTLVLNAKKFESLGSGSTFKEISKSEIKTFNILIPSNIKVQQKIVAILSSVDEAIEKTEQIIHQTEKVKSGVMQQLLTKGVGHTQFKHSPLGEIPSTWEVLSVKEFASVEYGISEAVSNNSDPNIGIPIITGANITLKGELNLSKKVYIEKRAQERFKLQKGDLLFNWRSGSQLHVGKTAIFNLDEDYTFASFILRIRVNNDDCDFQYYHYLLNYLKSIEYFSKDTSVQVNFKLNATSFRDLLLMKPPLREQKQISKKLSSIDYKIKIEQQKLSKILEIKQGLMQDLLTGKVRVPIDNEEVVET